MADMNEDKLLTNVEAKAKQFSEKYEEVFEEVAESTNFGGDRQFSEYDAYVLGSQFEMWAQYEDFCKNENASAADLGTLPKIATDLIAATYATSVAPLLSSTQVLDEQVGIVYYKGLFASDTRGGVTAGDELAESKTGWADKDLDKYGSEKVDDEALAAITTALTQTLTFAQGPVRSNIAIPVTFDAAPTFEGTILNGTLLHNGVVDIVGTFNYVTGELALTFGTAPVAGGIFTVTYHTDFEKSDDIPEIEMRLTSKSVTAEVMALKQPVSTLKAFQFNKRFGKMASDEALMDLSGSMADIESRKVIKMLNKIATAQGTAVSFSKAVPAGTSAYEHRQAFKFALATLDTRIGVNAGRGVANRYVVGYDAAEYFNSLNGFTKAPQSSSVGPQVYGYLDGITVIRALPQHGIATNDVLACYLNASSPWEAPIVTATYMPVFITSTMQVSNNPLQHQKAIASWKAFDSVVPQFSYKLTIVA